MQPHATSFLLQAWLEQIVFPWKVFSSDQQEVNNLLCEPSESSIHNNTSSSVERLKVQSYWLVR